MNETQTLVAIAMFTFYSFVPYAVAVVMDKGFMWLFLNRDETPEVPAWGQRALRAQRNQMDNLAAFALIVVAAKSVDASSDAVLAGATLFLWSRVAHLVIYVAGVPYLRTVAFAVSIAAMIDIARAGFAAT